MKYIVKNGFKSKNYPANSLDAIKMALLSDDVSGVQLNINLTKDHHIVVYQFNCIENHHKHKISDLTLYDLKKYNLGNKIRQYRITTLEEVLEIFENSSKILLLNIDNYGENNKILVEKLAEVINSYSQNNVYIKSYVKEIVLELMESVKNAKIGAVINNADDFFEKLDLSFYSINMENNEIDSVVTASEIADYFMIENIGDKEDLENMKKQIDPATFEDLYVIGSISGIV